jgi:hypothetical protein
MYNRINNQFKLKPPNQTKQNKTDLTDIYKDIYLEPYGCFSSLDEKIFLKEINNYSNKNIFDSGIIISENKTDTDLRDLINRVKSNGYDKYANTILAKYNKDPDEFLKKINIIEIGTLGKLAGYSYLSIYKTNEHSLGKIFLTYSPPMDNNDNKTKSDLPTYTLTPILNNYTNEQEQNGKPLACGYPCLQNNEPLTFTDNGVKKQYMCGSFAYPNIKTPSRFAVYHIAEK